MKRILFAAVSALGLMAGNAWAESNYLAFVETPATAASLQANSVVVEGGSEAIPVFAGVGARTQSNLVLSDTGSDATPLFNGKTVSYGGTRLGFAQR